MTHLEMLRQLPWRKIVAHGKAHVVLGKRAARSGTAFAREARKRLPKGMVRMHHANDNHMSP